MIDDHHAHRDLIASTRASCCRIAPDERIYGATRRSSAARDHRSLSLLTRRTRGLRISLAEDGVTERAPSRRLIAVQQRAAIVRCTIRRPGMHEQRTEV